MAYLTDISAENRDEGLVDELVALWRRSVEASHHFLIDGDIERIEPEARGGIAGIETLYVAWVDDDEKTPAGFAGVQDGKLEMLFIDADARGNGYGSLLIEHAMENDGVEWVDVNEDNVRAVEFYRKKGFAVVGRSESDDAGRPYPILHMRMAQS